jgi:ABC-type uncharacterized transport system ATPase subunit
MVIHSGPEPGPTIGGRADGREGPLAIETDSLTKIYERGKGMSLTAVDAISLTIPRGQVIGLLGPNGAGNPAAIEPPEGPAGAVMSRTLSIRNHPKGATG